MSQPKAQTLNDKQIAEIEERLNKGWVIRRHHIEPLLAMAKERNILAAEKEQKPAS